MTGERISAKDSLKGVSCARCGITAMELANLAISRDIAVTMMQCPVTKSKHMLMRDDINYLDIKWRPEIHFYCTECDNFITSEIRVAEKHAREFHYGHGTGQHGTYYLYHVICPCFADDYRKHGNKLVTFAHAVTSWGIKNLDDPRTALWWYFTEVENKPHITAYDLRRLANKLRDLVPVLNMKDRKEKEFASYVPSIAEKLDMAAATGRYSEIMINGWRGMLHKSCIDFKVSTYITVREGTQTTLD